MHAPSPPLARSLDLEWVINSKEFARKGFNPIRVADVSISEGLYGRVNSFSMLATNKGIIEELEEEELSLV